MRTKTSWPQLDDNAMHLVELFIAECTIVGEYKPKCRYVTGAVLFAEYELWFKAKHGPWPLANNTFAEALKRLGYSKHKAPRSIHWVGILLTDK